jgi:hypothetical protein
MAKKKKRRAPRAAGPGRPSQADPQATTAPPRGAERSAVRRERKEEARRLRDRARKQARRQAFLARFLRASLVGTVVVVVAYFVFRAEGAKPLSEEALAAAEAAGCSEVQTPAGSPGRDHLQSGQSYAYPEEPATSGPHAPGALGAGVYQEMPDETQVVHSLEHALVAIWYRAGGDAKLPQEVVDGLTTFAEGETSTILAPHTSLLEGTSLAFTAWNKLLTCGPGITSEQAATIAQGWHDSFACTRNAPEPENCGA